MKDGLGSIYGPTAHTRNMASILEEPLPPSVSTFAVLCRSSGERDRSWFSDRGSGHPSIIPG